jgi:hypothetical protein
MAVRGDFSWPSAGNSDDRPRGILMAAYGAIAMAVDRLTVIRPFVVGITECSPDSITEIPQLSSRAAGLLRV